MPPYLFLLLDLALTTQAISSVAKFKQQKQRLSFPIYQINAQIRKSNKTLLNDTVASINSQKPPLTDCHQRSCQHAQYPP